ncbi:MAG: HEAT repeat domain-containing protein, partial [Pyrinomonadaceae bacterium]
HMKRTLLSLFVVAQFGLLTGASGQAVRREAPAPPPAPATIETLAPTAAAVADAIAVPEIYGPATLAVGGDYFVWSDEDERDREELRQSRPLNAGARITLSNIRGPIEIETKDSGPAEVHIVTYSYGRKGQPAIEHTPTSLSIKGGRAGGERSAWDRGDQARHHVRLVLPRRVELVIEGATDSVRVGELEGPVSLSDVRGSIGIAQATEWAELKNVRGSVTAYLTRVGQRGVRVSDVHGRVTLKFVGALDADLRTQNVKGKVYVDLPDVAVEGEMSRTDVRARIGRGGAPLNVSDVAGTVNLTRGATVAELIEQLRASGRSNWRMEAARDLALHAGNRQARQALLETLNSDAQNSAMQMTAARALAPYAGEPEVRAAFVNALERTSQNSTVRMTAARALTAPAETDRAVRDAMLRVLLTEKNNAVRLSLIGALSKHAAEPAVQQALLNALKSDEHDVVRMRAARALKSRVEQAEVYDALLEAAKSDQKRIVRAQALDALGRRIRERPELRQLFVGYLDDESSMIQYHALKGLVELGDASLKGRLVEKSKEIITGLSRRHWNDRMLLDTILLLRKLDPQEAERALDQLAVDARRER